VIVPATHSDPDIPAFEIYRGLLAEFAA